MFLSFSRKVLIISLESALTCFLSRKLPLYFPLFRSELGKSSDTSEDVDFERCQIRINAGKGGKDRIVPFPVTFKEILAMHVETMRQKKATYLFESTWKRKYTTRGIHKLLAKYAEAAGLEKPISPHQLGV